MGFKVGVRFLVREPVCKDVEDCKSKNPSIVPGTIYEARVKLTARVPWVVPEGLPKLWETIKGVRRKYPGVEFADLDDFEQEEFRLIDEHGEEFSVYVSKILLDKSFVKISPCRAKTHDTVVVTLTIKNIVMGGIRRGYKPRMHRGYYSKLQYSLVSDEDDA